MGKYEVTQGQWHKVMGNDLVGNFRFSRGDNDYPTYAVSWEETQDFLIQLNKKSGKTYRLPTEAEWEYACRANSPGKYCGGDNLDAVAWYEKNSDGRLHHVGGKQGNTFGLYDMSGNVSEWCADWYGYYHAIPKNNPLGPSSGSQRVTRGGHIGSTSRDLRSTARSG